MKCPSLLEILTYAVEDRIPQEQQGHFEGACETCARRLQLARQLPGTAQRVEPGPPERLRRMAYELAGDQTLLGRMAAYIGELLSPPKLVPVLRGAAPATQLLYAAGEAYEIDLTLLDDLNLVGQLLATDGSLIASGGTALLSNAGESWTSPIEEDGEFNFEGIESGRYDLLIARSGERILIENIDLS